MVTGRSALILLRLLFLEFNDKKTTSRIEYTLLVLQYTKSESSN